jgi:hypothetical protein
MECRGRDGLPPAQLIPRTLAYDATSVTATGIRPRYRPRGKKSDMMGKYFAQLPFREVQSPVDCILHRTWNRTALKTIQPLIISSDKPTQCKVSVADRKYKLLIRPEKYLATS